MADPIPARMLNELVYCHRLFHFMHVQKLFADNADTVEGRDQHERARPDTRARDLRVQPPWGGQTTRAMTLTTRDGRLSGKFDVVATASDGSLVPVESKHGSVPTGYERFEVEGVALPADAWPTDQIQVGAQALLLLDSGETCREGCGFRLISNTDSD